MTPVNILKELNPLFIEVMDNKDIVLSETTKASDIVEWDSLAHIQLIITIEKHFKIRFTSVEIQSWKCVEDVINSIVARTT